MTVRAATPGDAPRLAELHAARIAEGFLASLGPSFLTRLYRRVTRADGSFAVVVEDDDGAVVGFAAGAVALGRLYREFLLRDGLVAGTLAAPRLVRSWRKVLETLRYPGGGDDLPPAEILAVAVDATATGRGVGGALVDAALAELRARGVPAARVVTGRDNQAALALYRRCGFVDRTTIEVHGGTPSQVLVWNAA